MGKAGRTRKLSEPFIIGNMSMLSIFGVKYLLGLVVRKLLRVGLGWRVL